MWREPCGDASGPSGAAAGRGYPTSEGAGSRTSGRDEVLSGLRDGDERGIPAGREGANAVRGEGSSGGRLLQPSPVAAAGADLRGDGGVVWLPDGGGDSGECGRAVPRAVGRYRSSHQAWDRRGRGSALRRDGDQCGREERMAARGEHRAVNILCHPEEARTRGSGCDWVIAELLRPGDPRRVHVLLAVQAVRARPMQRASSAGANLRGGGTGTGLGEGPKGVAAANQASCGGRSEPRAGRAAHRDERGVLGPLRCAILIAAIGGQPDFSALEFTINKSTLMYGHFINSVVSF